MNIILILVIGLSLLVFSYFTASSLRTLKATQFGNIVKMRKNNKDYSIQDLPDKQGALDMINKIDEWVVRLIDSLLKEMGHLDAVQRLATNYNSDSLIEGDPLNKNNYTSYSINKGQNLIICLRSRQNLEVHNFTLISFVVAHELAHLASVSVGHNKEFYKNFKMILSHAIKKGMFDINYFEMNEKVEYCGMNIYNNPVKGVLNRK